MYMNNKLFVTFWIVLTASLFFACKPQEKLVEKEEKMVEALPMNEAAFADLTFFDAPAENWRIAGGVKSDFRKEKDIQISEGNGVLVNQPSGDGDKNIFTAFEHGDIELEFDFLMPKGSNSGVYLQSRYEVQLLDSWGVENPSSGDAGGIYQRWDDSKPEGERGFEGHAPAVNASLAPGLWQHMKILFHAPKFDKNGEKVANAIMKHVVHNGITIHRDVELKGATRASAADDEVAKAPLMIQGDHGPVAFRNFKYKLYGDEKIQINNLTYNLYEGKWSSMPELDSLKPDKVVEADSFMVPRRDHYALLYKGELDIPVSGDYLFTTMIDDGGDFSIDGKEILVNQGDPGLGSESTIINLEAGKHDFTLSYYQEVWLPMIVVYYEGPGIERKTLASIDATKNWGKTKPYMLDVGEEPELLRGFVNYGDGKRTHTISVGDPGGLHYSYDLDEGSLIKAWKGEFGDVNQMWVNRGIEQTLLPVNPAIELIDGFPIGNVKGETDWPDNPADLKYRGYKIKEDGRPTFMFELGNASISDEVFPTSEKGWLGRKISVKDCPGQQVFRMGKAQEIVEMGDGLYRLDTHFLKTNAKTKIRSTGDAKELIAELNGGNIDIEYQLMW